MKTRPIRIDEEVAGLIERKGRFGETHNDVLRRLLNLSSREKEKQMGTNQRYFIFGIPGVRVLRWMRDYHWTKSEARRVFDSYGQHVHDRTIECQFQENRDGPVAELTPSQIKELTNRK